MPFKSRAKRREYERTYWRKNSARRRDHRYYQDKARHANRRAALYGAQGRITTADIRRLLAGSPACTYCGSNNGPFRMGIDHVVPLDKHGENHVSNIVPCCHSCNASKWRTEKPWRWARAFDACTKCGNNDSKHVSKGLCERCYNAKRYAIRRTKKILKELA